MEDTPRLLAAEPPSHEENTAYIAVRALEAVDAQRAHLLGLFREAGLSFTVPEPDRLIDEAQRTSDAWEAATDNGAGGWDAEIAAAGAMQGTMQALALLARDQQTKLTAIRKLLADGPPDYYGGVRIWRSTDLAKAIEEVLK